MTFLRQILDLSLVTSGRIWSFSVVAWSDPHWIKGSLRLESDVAGKGRLRTTRNRLLLVHVAAGVCMPSHCTVCTAGHTQDGRQKQWTSVAATHSMAHPPKDRLVCNRTRAVQVASDHWKGRCLFSVVHLPVGVVHGWPACRQAPWSSHGLLGHLATWWLSWGCP